MLPPYYTQLYALKGVLSDPLLVGGIPTTNMLAQDPSNILRLGGAVVVYALLEQHIEACFERMLAALSLKGFDLGLLPAATQQFLLTDALSTAANLLKFEESGNRFNKAHGFVASLNAAVQTPSVFRIHGLRNRGSNLSVDNVEQGFAALGVRKLFKNVVVPILRETGGSRPDPKGDFSALAKLRNKSAHNGGHNISSSELRNHIDSALLIGIALDCASFFTSEAFAALRRETDLQGGVGVTQRKYRLIDDLGTGRVTERVSGNGRISKVYTDIEAAVRGAVTRAERLPLVVRRASLPIAVVIP